MTNDRKGYLTEFMRDFDFPDEAQSSASDALDKIFAVPECRGVLENVCRLYEKNREFDWSAAIDSAARLAELSSQNVFTVNLVVLVLLTEISKKHYTAEGVSEEIWRQNFKDLRYKCAECKLVKGVHGIFCPGWYDRFFNVTRFSFGKLQFETNDFGHEYSKNGLSLLPEDRVIYVHIPRTGEKLYPADVDDACLNASAFYKKKYGFERIVFVCHSWLLYPLNKQLLSANSNLYSFISRFDIIEEGESADYKDAWRLFDVEYNGDPEELPRDTSFRKAYYQRIKNREPLGWGFGVWIYDRG